MNNNIIGEPFRDYVAKQINLRQETHGSGAVNERNIQDITVLNSNTAWVKLASGVNVSEQRMRDAGLSHFGWGDKLAKDFILFGGVSSFTSVDSPLQQRTGLLGKNGIYNISGDSKELDFGLVPMPGIESVDIKCLNRGSIKKATIKLKVYSKTQFDIIDILYLRLGYTVLLEWGNSVYKSNQTGNLEQMGYTFIEADGGFFSNNLEKESPLQILNRLEGWRKSKSGNYDSLLARVVNFEWSFAQDGSYDITLSLISLGDIVESLKINISPGKKEFSFIDQVIQAQTSNTEEESNEEKETNDPSPLRNKIAAHLFVQKMFFKQSPSPAGGITYKINGESFPIGAFVKPSTQPLEVELEDETITLDPADTNQKKQDVVYFYYNNGEEEMPEIPLDLGFYMRFGYLLQFIRNFVLPKISKGNSPNPPLIDIDFNTWRNKMYYFPGQISLDPRVCVVNGEIGPNSEIDAFNQLAGWHHPDKGYAWPMNIYVSFATIQTSLDSNLDNDGNLNLQSFLSSICDALNVSLGGVNNLEPIVNEDDNSIKIIDSSYSEKPKPSQDYTLMLYGYGDGKTNPKNTSTFVRNIDLKTAITPEYASMVTVGATAGGYVKGTEATMFSKWNKGITDRFAPKLEPGDPETAGPSSSSTPPQPSGGIVGGALAAAAKFEGDEALIQYIVKFYATGKLALGYKYDGNGETPQLDDTAIENNKSIATEFYKYAHSKIHEKYPDWSSPTIGFIPFSLGLTMDGLAGIKIYNALKVDTSFLPTNYPNSLSFIITGVDHKLSNNDWETTIQTHVIPETEKQNGTPTATSTQIKDTVFSLLNGAGIGNIQLDTTLANNNIGNSAVKVAQNPPGNFGKGKWFAPNPLKEYKGSDWIIDHEGWKDYKTGTLRGKNIDLIITEFRKAGLKNPYAMVGILAVNSKESNFILKDGENMNYNKGRLPEVWAAFSTTGKVVAKGEGKKYANDLAAKYANDPVNLSNFVYGSKDSIPQGMRSSNGDGGNKKWGDGWKYRGRGWNGLTFKGAYEKYGKKIGKDLVNHPELMEDSQIATQVLIEYYKSAFASKKGGAISFWNSLPSVEDAIYYFAGSTAGWVDNSSTGWQGGFNKAVVNKNRFKIVYK